MPSARIEKVSSRSPRGDPVTAPLCTKKCSTAEALGPVRIISAAGANSANDRINRVREDIDSVWVTKETPAPQNSKKNSEPEDRSRVRDTLNILVFAAL
jgi:hypothetical protein